MSDIIKPVRIFPSQPTLEGAGVRLKRAIGFHEVPDFDPFLLLDDIHSTFPGDYMAGFPWHPHRGIETVTYVINGLVEHGDSIGNSGSIGSGDVQWMTAGSGIIHQEMPHKWSGDMRGLQLWVNLPASHKMMEPRYRDIRSDTIPELTLEDGTGIKVIAGRYDGHEGPLKDLIRNPEYLDVKVPPDNVFTHSITSGHTVFAYVLEGTGLFNPEDKGLTGAENTVLYGEGDEVVVGSGGEGLRFLLFSGEPLGEPVAWRGPIVMNTSEELETAFAEYHAGTFIKHGDIPG